MKTLSTNGEQTATAPRSSAGDATRVMRDREDIERAVAGKTLGDVLLRNAQLHGELPAMSWKDGTEWRTLNWREVRERVAEAAMGLVGLGVEHGDVVAIMASNRPEHVVADLAIMHAAGTPTSFYSTLASEQVQYVANDSAVKVAILENRDYMKRWQEIKSELPSLETIVLLENADEFTEFDGVMSWDDLVANGRKALREDRAAFDERWRSVRADDVACVIYTSGTTGPPKGVQITQHNIMFGAESLDRTLRGSSDDGNEQSTSALEHYVAVSYLPLAHISERSASIYMSLWKAGHAYYCPDPTRVLEFIQHARPQMFSSVPRVWEKVKAGILAKINAEENDTRRKLALKAIQIGTVVTRLRQAGERPSAAMRAEYAVLDKLVLSKIRASLGLDRAVLCISAAAPLSRDVAEFFRAIGLPLTEAWGMTELTAVGTISVPDAFRVGRVGQVLPGVELRIAEDGEILIRGPIQVPGYRNRPDATAELIDLDGWLHTGDVGEIDADGYLKIVDRKKELIITAGGKNISPANIEALLKEHPLVGQALAYGDRKPYVTALLVLDSEMAPGWARSQGIEETSLEALAAHPKVREVLEQAVEKANSHLARVEQVKRFAILGTEWTAGSEELTPTMKLKRRVVHDKYRSDIERLYAGA